MPLYYPGTTILVTQSFEDRLKIAEFDDALVDQVPWKNPRYDGSKLIAKEINKFTQPDIITFGAIPNLKVGTFKVGLSGSVFLYGGDSPHPAGLSPIVSNKTTAIYIANTVVGGTEDPQFASIKKHSYVGINRILLINEEDDTVEILDKTVEDYDSFHRFITDDLPTGGEFKIKLLDSTVQTNLKQNYKVKMNKGYLLTSFDFRFASSSGDKHLAENNTMYFYRSGSNVIREFHTGSLNSNPIRITTNGKLKFRYAKNQFYPPGIVGTGSRFAPNTLGPSFASSSIIENKFTKQYYSGSFGFIFDNPNGSTDSQILKNSGYGSASKFINYSTLNFLKKNTEDVTIPLNQKTELHITFFEGEKDFSSGSNDERSIGTFEVDSNLGTPGVAGGNLAHDGRGDECNGFLPHIPELTFKGEDDNRFIPPFEGYNDDIVQMYLESTSSVDPDTLTTLDGCQDLGEYGFASVGAPNLKGTSVNRIDEGEIYFQGGDLGPLGNLQDDRGTQIKISSGSLNENHFYSGSVRYQLSFLDKDHTIITDLNKEGELFDGVGSKEIILIPNNLTQNIKSNLEFYLFKAGLIDSAPITKAPINKNQSN